ncbi:MAG: DUF998 domain-containing protein [Propionibacteriaceae bacterium]|nr:DUF998 domain-containing protein [Propionibacteriaceae bacterium]
MRRRGVGRWPLASLAVLVTYNTWLLAIPLNAHRQIFNGYLSELSASDQPHHLFFRAGDLVTSLIVGALGVRALFVWPRRHQARPRWWILAAAALMLFACSTVIDSFLPMDCSPTLSASCKLAEETGRLSMVHYAHTFTSVGAQIGVVASMVGVFVAMRRTRAGGLLWQRLMLAIWVGEVGLLSVLLVMVAAGVPGIGYVQAVTVALASVWFAAVGVALVGEDTHWAPRTEPLEEDVYAR